jgi:hypothetical protein
MPPARSTVSGRFVEEIIRSIRKEHCGALATAIEGVIPDETAAPLLWPADIVSYYALCERAWLHWSRLALDHVTTHVLLQTSAGAFNPSWVRSAHEAGEAQTRCGLHQRLIDLAGESRDGQNYGWRLESARQVHASTQRALKVAATIDARDPPSVYELYPGIASAADALVAASLAGFVTDAPSEVRETFEAMLGEYRSIERRTADGGADARAGSVPGGLGASPAR